MQLPFTLNTYANRVSRTKERMGNAGVDVLLVTLPDNIHYLCGYDTIGYLWFQALAVSDLLDTPLFLTRTTEMPGTWETSCVRDAHFYDIARENPVEVLASLLQQRGLGDKRIGVEKSSFTLTASQWDTLQRSLPGATFVDASELVFEERLVKDPREVEYQRAAAQMADAGMLAGLAALRPGISEVEIAGIMSEALGAAGSEFPAIPPMVASGTRSTMIHAMASRKALAPGDVVILELAGACNRYHAVMMRTAVIGRPSPRVTEAYSCLQEATDAAIASIVPGASPGAPEDACTAILDRLDLTRRRAHRLGYSLGLAYPPTWLETTLLVHDDPHTIGPNMSFTIEPNLSLYEDGFGLKLGDTVLCTEQGPEVLSALSRDLVVIE